jgi:2-dehydro-3-deoxyphosphogalactonate aldolase
VAGAGGTYVISPNTNLSVIRRTLELGLLSVPGFLTPTEAFQAIDAGAEILKCFPCGSPGNISVLKSVIPKPILAVGGISRENRDEYLAAAAGVGVGIGIYRPGMSLRELSESAGGFFQGMKG